MAVEFEPFEISAHLDSEEMIAGYLSAAAEDEDPNVLLGALLHAAKAQGMMQVARAAGLNRESLYKALKPGAHPRFGTVQAVLRALGVKLAMTARGGEARAEPDEVADESRRLAKEVVERVICEAGKKLSDVEAGKLTQAVDALVEADHSYVEQAKENVAARRRPVTTADFVKQVTERIRGQPERAAKSTAHAKTAAHAKSGGKARTATRLKERASSREARGLHRR